MDPPVQSLAAEWLRLDKNPETRAEIENLLAEDNVAELELRLRKRIAFGTAGLRATMKAGFAHMNDLIIIQASQGYASYLLKEQDNVLDRGIVIGHDARFNSEHFARLAAAAFIAKGICVKWLGQVHTPMVPFALTRLQAAGGIMVTASHNEAEFNGYKVYWSNGCQIIPPTDVGIAHSILSNLEPVTWDTASIHFENPLMIDALPLVYDDYIAAVHKVAKIANPAKRLPFVYTPMHGVGLPFFLRALSSIGLEKDVHVVAEQAEPDPSFPTVRFPNPEEKGALDLAKQTADSASLSLILANDPDADRFAVAEKVHGTWRQLTGNQLGVLLASHVLETYQSKDKSKGLAMLASTVSSKMLAKMAAVEGSFKFEETLTGFKWLGNKARDLVNAGYDAAFAYEEAIGYMFGGVVFDKDGVAAASVFLAACHRWEQNNLTPWSKYEQLCQKYGFFEEANTYLVSPSPDVTNAVFAGVRENRPSHVGQRSILRWRDLTTGFDTGTPDNVPTLSVDNSSQMISCGLEGNVFFTVRGSGTEPKIKFYIEGSAATAVEAKTAADSVLNDLLIEWFKPDVNGLRLA